ncbi:MAG TPA: PepSY domain-containing protein [Gemmatimonadales bacterium]|nr:PepSY domain-containing protein [Gemmatimonadales bacterium]
MNTSMTTAIRAGVLLSAAGLATPSEARGQAEKPLSEIIKSIEDQQLGSITEADLDHGRWEVEVHKDGRKTTLYLDPKTGAVDRRKERADAHEVLPPEDARPLSELIKSVEDQKLGPVTEVDYDDGFWEVEVRKGGTKTKLDIDPKTGETRTR